MLAKRLILGQGQEPFPDHSSSLTPHPSRPDSRPDAHGHQHAQAAPAQTMLKRQMYGRAGFKLLRKRVLLAS